MNERLNYIKLLDFKKLWLWSVAPLVVVKEEKIIREVTGPGKGAFLKLFSSTKVNQRSYSSRTNQLALGSSTQYHPLYFFEDKGKFYGTVISHSKTHLDKDLRKNRNQEYEIIEDVDHKGKKIYFPKMLTVYDKNNSNIKCAILATPTDNQIKSGEFLLNEKLIKNREIWTIDFQTKERELADNFREIKFVRLEEMKQYIEKGDMRVVFRTEWIENIPFYSRDQLFSIMEILSIELVKDQFGDYSNRILFRQLFIYLCPDDYKKHKEGELDKDIFKVIKEKAEERNDFELFKKTEIYYEEHNLIKESSHDWADE